MPFSKEKRNLAPEDFKNANIGFRYWESSLELIPEHCTHKEKLKKYIKNAFDFYRKGTGILFFGFYGEGKTSCGVILLKEMMSHESTVCFATASQIKKNCLLFTPEQFKSGTESYPITQRYESVDFLMIDDLGSENPTEPFKAELESLIRSRYNNLKPTIITTNLLINESSNKKPTIKDVYGEGLFSVMKESVKFTLVSGHNWRDSVEN